MTPLNRPDRPADGSEVSQLVLAQGLRDTRAVLAGWAARPWGVLGRWTAGAFATAVALLVATWVIAVLERPDPTPMYLPGVHRPGDMADVGHILWRNSLVLALHAMACVAGFIARSSLPQEAERYSGTWRWIHDKAGTLAIGFVVCATTFSLVTQAYVLGGGASTLSEQLGISPALLLVCLLPHALPELTALFLPLAAWIVASRRGDWHELLAATFVTVALAAPVLIVSAFVEVYLSPELVLDAIPHS